MRTARCCGRQQLDDGEEGQLDGLAGDDDRVGLGIARSDLVEQPVGVGLQPRDLGEGAQRGHAPRAAADRVERRVGGDAVQPGPEPGAALEAVAAAPRAQEGLLHEVLGLLERAEHAVAVHVQLAAVALHEGGEGGLVAGLGGGDERIGLGVAHRRVHPASWWSSCRSCAVKRRGSGNSSVA